MTQTWSKNGSSFKTHCIHPSTKDSQSVVCCGLLCSADLGFPASALICSRSLSGCCNNVGSPVGGCLKDCLVGPGPRKKENCTAYQIRARPGILLESFGWILEVTRGFIWCNNHITHVLPLGCHWPNNCMHVRI